MLRNGRDLRVAVGALSLLIASATIAGCDGCNGSSYATRDSGVDMPAEMGSVSIDAGFDVCPTVIAQVAPQEVTVGQSVTVNALVSSQDGETVTFAWTSDSGTFASSSAQSTTFKCTTAGFVNLMLQVSDGACTSSQQFSIVCDGVPDGGGAGGAGGMSMSGGGGAGGAGGAGGGGQQVTNTCPSAEPPSPGSMCPDCTSNNCSLGPTGTDGCCGLQSDKDQLLCVTLYACLVANQATCVSNADPTVCFCGTSGLDCFMTNGSANGPCTAAFYAAAKATTASVVQSQFSSPGSPVGRAVNLLECRADFCVVECNLPQ